MDGYDYKKELKEILENSRVHLSDILPSEWVEKNRLMTADVSSIPGMFSYNNSPYTREIVDCLSPSHPARIIAIMKGAQIGFSAGFIESGIGYLISEAPGNILFLVGHEELVKKAGKKIDNMLDNSGLRHLIKSTANKSRKTKSGDTDKLKEFPGGFLSMGITNHKTLRQDSIRYGFIDDFEGMKGDTKEAGDTTKMIEQRFSSYAKSMKLAYISTPERKETSNIEPVYLLGDQRKYHVPCPCCDELIVLEWQCRNKVDVNKPAGITWSVDEVGKLIPESVGYVCPECGDFFDDSMKTDMILKGRWIPTAEPSKPGYYSYHISALYAPVYMYGWEHYVREYLEANPPDGVPDNTKMKTFTNLVLGETYEEVSTEISANELQKNIRPYDIGLIPEKLSIADGNGKIVLITCGVDLGGKDDSYKNHGEDDARIDYEILAFSESGATYSITHGSIGTFQPGDKNEDRVKWTYKHGHPNSVWPELDMILSTDYETDTGRSMRVFIAGIDSGFCPTYVYQYVENSNLLVVSLKGKDETKYVNPDVDRKMFKQSQEHGKLYLIESNLTKDRLAEKMGLKWNQNLHDIQPDGFMNFPTPSDGKYLFTNYFAHFEAEHRVLDGDKFVWKKKNSNLQNHLYDCRLYSLVTKDILLDKVFKEMKIQNGVWQDYVNIIRKND